MNARALFRAPPLWVAVVLVALSVLWKLIGAPISLITQIAIYALYGAGVNLLVGYTGLAPFGASVFFGCASYVTALALLDLWPNEFAALAASVIFSMLLGLAIGALILRRRGLYFSLLTLAFSQIAFEVAFKWTDVTGGENGLQNVPRPTFPSDLSYHVFVVAVVVAAFWLMWRVVHAPFGRVMQAVRDNEQRAASLGYNVYLVRLWALTLMAGVVGLAGAMLTLMLQGVYADNLSWQHAGDSLLMTVLGGVHHFLGPLWGAIVFIIMQDRLSAITENWWLVFAPVVIVFALASPEGVEGLWRRLFGGSRWTLTRNTIPSRPAAILAYESAAAAMDPARPILETRKLSKHFGSLVTAREIDLTVMPFVLHSIIGPNGAGKTTLFNMLSGVLPPSGGQVLLDGKDITRLPLHARARLGIGRSFQILSIFPNLTVFENVRVAVQAEKQGLGGLIRDAHANAAINERAWSVLDAVGLVARAAEEAASLPHGAKRLLEIAVTLSTRSKLLLLDEPLAGLAEADRIVVTSLIRRLARSHAVLLIEHDIDRVLAISDRISVLHQGRMIADGQPAEVARNPEVIAAYLGAARDGERAAPRPVERRAEGRPLLQIRGLSAGYAGGTVLEGVNFTVREGEAVALLGRNGVGKTTLLRAITGTLPITAGAVNFAGETISGRAPYLINRAGVSLVPEGRRLFPNLTTLDNLKIAMRPGGMGLDDVFNLFPRLKARQRARAENLSGGERQMVAIARALVAPSKLILLDEPFEGLAPAVVNEVMAALRELRGRVAMVIVEHHAESVLPIVDCACVLVNGAVAFEGDAAALEANSELQTRLLGVVQAEETAAS